MHDKNFTVREVEDYIILRVIFLRCALTMTVRPERRRRGGSSSC